jgi:hypothetical protein
LGVGCVIRLVTIFPEQAQIDYSYLCMVLGAATVLFSILVMNLGIPLSIGMFLLIFYIGYVFIHAHGEKTQGPFLFKG